MYTLEYLPSAKQDMEDAIRYISRNLYNPAAAKKLAMELISAIDKIPAFPYANPAYIPIRPLSHEYRKLSIENYIVFYWVNEKQQVVTIVRIIYAGRDYERLL